MVPVSADRSEVRGSLEAVSARLNSLPSRLLEGHLRRRPFRDDTQTLQGLLLEQVGLGRIVQPLIVFMGDYGPEPSDHSSIGKLPTAISRAPKAACIPGRRR